MYFLESLKSAIQSIKANKMRSFLTMLGIIIGISSVITIVSIGEGAKQFITGEFEGMGTNVINLQMNSSSDDIQKRDYFTLEDVDLITDKVPEVTAVVPIVSGMGSFKANDKSKRVYVSASNHKYPEIQNIKLSNGRFLNEHDVDTNKNVAVIDQRTAEELFNDAESAVGKKAKINIGDKYLDLSIVGVLKSEEGLASFDGGRPGQIYIPITIREQIMKSTDIGYMSVIVSDMSKADDISSKIIRIIENKHRNSGKYTAIKGFAELDSINKILNMLILGLGTIAAISLLVGGIGVMNIMLVSVTERTREIGIRKAIGAKTSDIKLQFLSESVILCLIGGIVGTILGISAGKMASKLMKVDIPVSLKVILIAFLFSSSVGIFFGLYPAKKAAKLDPIDALRYE
ncbi:ABC transporter permease [Clostridium peptidivorans]|uniref:ABC transporter permease n=1 Tax=Clostridium peptidivorans TaxID=100174 RepID=UPI000BE23EAE|nr:ABC transporter permease [Clostridium peptidivorans]